MLECAAQLVFAQAERRAPLLGLAGDVQIRFAEKLEMFPDGHVRGTKDRVLLFRQDREAAIEHRQSEHSRKIFDVKRRCVGFLGIA